MIISIILTINIFTVRAYNIGDIIGYAQPTDIIATINGYQLLSYNVDGYTYIVAEDLKAYGMNVVYDDASRTLTVTRNTDTVIDPVSSNPDYMKIGTKNVKTNILYTDIVTYVEGALVKSFNINGATIIPFNDLAHFGLVHYNNDRREISLTIENVNTNPTSDIAKYLEAVISTPFNNYFNKAYKKINPNAYCKTFVRAKGNVVSIDSYINGITLTKSQINAETKAAKLLVSTMKSQLDSIAKQYPECKALILNVYDDTKRAVITYQYSFK